MYFLKQLKSMTIDPESSDLQTHTCKKCGQTRVDLNRHHYVCRSCKHSWCENCCHAMICQFFGHVNHPHSDNKNR